MSESIRLGSKIRALRRRESLTQAQLAERLAVSPSYLNLIENNRRPLTATLLIKLAQIFQLDIQTFATDDAKQTVSELLEVFGDSLFDGFELGGNDIREFAHSCPTVARGVLSLYQAYRGARESALTLAHQISESGDGHAALPHNRLPSEEVSDFLQRQLNYFPELEDGAARLRTKARLDDGSDLFRGLEAFLADHHGVGVKVDKVNAMRGAVRRFDPQTRQLTLSELLRRGSRNFQLAHQVGLLTQGEVIEPLVRDATLTSDESRALCRVALANYFAGAVLMPYPLFLDAAKAERYDIELLGHRFRTSFEQVCHRLTTLRRPGSDGVPFHFVRVDIAGNISKRFSASGMRFARFSAACPRWNVHAAFLTPGRIRVQLSSMPDGTAFFCVTRTLRKDTGGYHSPHAVHAIELGCEVRHARELVYSDGVDLDNLFAAVPVGITCRLCERLDCEQRAFPGIQHHLQINENVRGISFFAPVEEP